MATNKKVLGGIGGLALIGVAGLALIQNSQGLRTKAYLDPVGIPTICYGHTGPEVKLGQTFSKEGCNTILLQDIALHQNVLVIGDKRNCINNVPLTQNQLDAVTSFVFNVGNSKFCASTMAKKLRVRDYIGAANEFPKWDKARMPDGTVVALPGLTTRRKAERALFLTNDRYRAVGGSPAAVGGLQTKG